ncbi:MAG: hypothetical protein J6U54_03410 [Clostridiales bacterium]|nr:hypothetical protein [Clostridiales bacterium]
MIEIPGANGIVDLTESLLGYPTYKTRNGSWSFKMAHDVTGLPWAEAYSAIAAYLHGRKMSCTLLDDRAYYYIGRFTIDELKTDKMCNSLTIQYELDPFKRLLWTTTEPWPWDPFDFIYGVINRDEFVDLAVSTANPLHLVWSQTQLGCTPIYPKITCTLTSGDSMTLKYTNSANGLGEQTFTLTGGVNENPQIEFACPNPGDTTTIDITGNGTVSIDFRPGGL